jgi:hypothetical protein
MRLHALPSTRHTHSSFHAGRFGHISLPLSELHRGLRAPPFTLKLIRFRPTASLSSIYRRMPQAIQAAANNNFSSVNRIWDAHRISRYRDEFSTYAARRKTRRCTTGWLLTGFVEHHAPAPRNTSKMRRKTRRVEYSDYRWLASQPTRARGRGARHRLRRIIC